MPILVQWKWVERTKSFLVIFHFFDDYSQPNLRMGEFKSDTIRVKALMTWAPSHVELGLLSEILRYANVIGGQNVIEKRELREKLELTTPEKSDVVKMFSHDDILEATSSMEKGLIHLILLQPRKGMPITGAETAVKLCPEYIDYLKKVLKPYTT